MKNILHLSDIHISNVVTKMNESRASSIMTCLIDDLISKNREIDTVFITGDLTNTAGEHEFELIKTKIIYPLIDKLKITKSDIFVTPGNHDIQRLNWKRADKFAKNDVFTNDHANKVNELFDEKNNDNDFNWFINYNNFIRNLGHPPFSASLSEIWDTHLFQQANQLWRFCHHTSPKKTQISGKSALFNRYEDHLDAAEPGTCIDAKEGEGSRL